MIWFSRASQHAVEADHGSENPEVLTKLIFLHGQRLIILSFVADFGNQHANLVQHSD